MTKRRYKCGDDRGQVSLLPARIEDYVHGENPVRAIDAYVDTLDLGELGFCYTGPTNGKGQPPYDPGAQLKLYIYGYTNQLRSSRRLERETHRNLEVIWLMGGLRPSYKTIADFRKDNAGPLKAVNKDFVLLCKELDLLGGKKCAIDGSFFHGNASKASIMTAATLDKQLAELDEKIARYQKELDQNDRSDEKTGAQSLHKDDELKEKLKLLEEKQREKQALKEKLSASGDTQISTTDADARLLNKGNGTVAGYNVQIGVDDKHKLIVASAVTNDGNDLHQLYPMAEKVKQALDVDALEALADAGYPEGEQLRQCEENGITVYAPMPDKSGKNKAEGRFARDDFIYDAKADIYRCPQGEALEKRGKPVVQNGKLMDRYVSKSASCKACPLREKCLTQKADRRHLFRWQHEDVVDRHRARMKGSSGKMRERSGLVEHPFGTLKCRAGWLHFLVRGFEKVGGEWALMATCYNFTRVLNVIGLKDFMDYCVQRRKMRAKSASLSRFCGFFSRYPNFWVPSGDRITPCGWR